jgi:hypothetical protein
LFLSAAPKKDDIPPVDPSVVYNATVKVLRGGACEVPLRAISPDGYDVEFEIVSQPRSGELSAQQRISKSSVSYFYTHDGNKNSTQDSFRFKCKSGPHKAWGYANVTIRVEEPPPRFESNVSALDFGSVFLGKNSTKTVRIKNAGGGLLQGRLKVSAPWSLAGPADISLSEGERKKILITFTPLSTDTQRGSLVFEYGSKPFAEIVLEGVGDSRFESPEKAAFEERVGASELRIPIKNLTADPLPLDIDFPSPLKAPHAITLPPYSAGELLLKLPSLPFTEKSVIVKVIDEAATHDIRVSLPPPPSRLEWAKEGGGQLGNETSGGRPHTLTTKLHNTGSATANAVLRAEGEGIALAPNQPANLTIAAGESMTVNATWKFPDTPGQFKVSLVAETDGLPPVKISWEANVQLPPVTATPTPTPTPPPPPPPPPIFPPRAPSYRLEPDLHWTAFFPSRRTVTAIVSWSYEGPELVEFIIQRELQERKGFFDERVQVPSDLPPQSSQPVWTDLNPSTAKIQKLPDGRWQARIPALSPGFHKIRVIAKTPNTTRMDGSEFNIRVGDIPLPQPLPWTLPGLLALCTTYLLRKKIRSLFG